MTPTPSGRVSRVDGEKYDLVLTRVFDAPIDDVWASVTESERTALWYGRWEGEAGAGQTIRTQMTHEEGQPWGEFLIVACEEPRRLALSADNEYGSWKLELVLEESDGATTLTFIHHLDTADGVGDIGPGWEYYLDALVASREGATMPDFADYHPSQSEHFLAQLQP